MGSLRSNALVPLLEQDALKKVRLTLALDAEASVRACEAILEPYGVPGRPAKPALVRHMDVWYGSLRTNEGRAALVHSIAHIELNAVDLALDVCWRFAGMPDQFYRDWIAIAKEEALHFTLLRDHLVSMGFDYGSFDAHNALWEMAERTKGDVLARVALVPRTLEARGLDATPAVKRKLVGAGDHRAGEILDVILRDEIGHVACGNRWYKYLCDQRRLDPISTYRNLRLYYKAPTLRAPFNFEARRAAGFTEVELEALMPRTSTQDQTLLRYHQQMAKSSAPPFDSLKHKGFDVLFVSHAAGILVQDFPEAVTELEQALSNLELPVTEIIGSGGGETKFTQRLRRTLAGMNWRKHIFDITKTVDGVPKESTSHEVDHVRRFEGVGVVAMEIEWNNKDPFFDRDLENFKRLHAEGAISVGVLVTRGSTLQASLWGAVRKFADDRDINSFDDLAKNGYVPTPKQAKNVMKRVTRDKDPVAFRDAWTDNFVSNKYGQATTHWDKLIHRVHRGVGNPCPLVLIGLPDSMVRFDQAKVDVMEEDEVSQQ